MEYLKICEYCSKEFQPSRSDARYCGAVCRTNAHKARKRGVLSSGSSKQGPGTRKPEPVKYSQVTNEAGLLSEVLRKLIQMEDRLKTLDDYEAGYILSSEACKLLHISKSTFDRYVAKGLLKTYYIKGSGSKTKKMIYVKRSDVQKLFTEA